MSTPLSARLCALGFLITAVSTYPPAKGAEYTGSQSILRGVNLLDEGVAALEAGRTEEGIRLTLEGLKGAVGPQESAYGHSNACAGYVRLKQWAEALAQCNAALALDTSNWRTYNNRAAIYIAQGLYDLGMRDLEAGLALAPGTPTLHESLRILLRNKTLAGREARKVERS